MPGLATCASTVRARVCSFNEAPMRATRPENVYRHEWSVGDLLLWDNCGVMHRALPYAADSGRLMHRTVLHGVERISGVDAGASSSTADARFCPSIRRAAVHAA